MPKAPKPNAPKDLPQTPRQPQYQPSERSLAYIDMRAAEIAQVYALEIAGFRPEARTLVERRFKKRIAQRKKEAALHAKVTPEMVIGATAMRAFASIDDAIDDEGNFSIEKARETGAIHLIKKYEKKADGTVRVEFYSNADAQDKLGNYLGMEYAPKDNSDHMSLKSGVDEVARQIAAEEGATEVTFAHRQLAWQHVRKWAEENRSKYSQETIREVGKEFMQ